MSKSNPEYSTDKENTVHASVLLHEVIEGLAIAPDDIVVDGTLGGGGHSQAAIAKLGPTGQLIAFDADRAAIQRARQRLGDTAVTVHYINQNARQLESVLAELEIAEIDKAMFDLGLSSDQLEQSGRGFSFMREEPLLMTFDDEQELTAAVIVNEWAEETLADIIYGYGEERAARKIAKAICQERERAVIATTTDLARIVERVIPRRGKTNPATKTFQALRIAVNDELGALETMLQSTFNHLAIGGRMAIISFHSLEDRMVKRFFREQAQQRHASLLTKKPVVPEPSEIMRNPRARSAKLRILEKREPHEE